MAISQVGSGLDTATLVQQLVDSERAPLQNRIARAEKIAKTQLSAIGSLKSAFSTLQTALDKLRKGDGSNARTTEVSKDAGFTASAGTTAAVGSYEIEVVNLATAHKLTSAGVAADKKIGTGTLVIQAGDKTIEVEVKDGRNTLADVRSAINAATGGKGVSASLVNADDGQHLVLTATDTGTKGALRITAKNDGGSLSSLVYDPGVQTSLTQTVEAKDAKVRVDGLLRNSSSNSITDLLPGVTLNLTAAKPDEKFTLKISADNAAMKTALQAFVAGYNAAMSMTRQVSAYNASTKTASALTGDSMVRGLQNQLRNVASEQVVDLKALGLKINTDGTLSLNATDLDKALAQDPGSIARLFSGDSGYGAKLDTMLKDVLREDGLLDSRSDSLDARLKTYTKQYSDLDIRMEAVKKRYTAQFTAMEQMVTKLQGSSGFLAQTLG